MLRHFCWMPREPVFLLSSKLYRVTPLSITPRRWLQGQRGSWENTGLLRPVRQAPLRRTPLRPVRQAQGTLSLSKRRAEGSITCPTASTAPLKYRVLFLLALLLFPLLVAAQPAEDPAATVQAILFYSPSCPHCHQVINELLIPMQDEYGEQLHIVGINTSNPAGQALYGRAIEHFKIPQNRRGVPALIVQDTILIGGMEIPDKFPGIVEEGLAAGGIGWPDIPDLDLIIPDLPPSADPTARIAGAEPAADDPQPDAMPTASSMGSLQNAGSETSSAEFPSTGSGNVESGLGELPSTGSPSTSSGGAELVQAPADPTGFALAWVVLIGMAAALVYAARQILIAWPLHASDIYQSSTAHATWLVPLLALLGLGVALYLAYVEITHVEAICGPVGECNIVQSSPYAQLFGIPVAVWGVLCYLAIIALWAGQQFLPARPAAYCSIGLILLTLFGTLFSVYLTLLEIFAIGAICAWCLTSAVITTLLLILITKNINRSSP